MCQEVFDLVCSMDKKNLELQMALHLAPVITGIKISNLFTIPEFQETSFRNMLKGSGLSYFFLARYKGNVSYLVYRRFMFEQYLQNSEAVELLEAEGYNTISIGRILWNFKERYQAYLLQDKGNFPHEIGLLLGYSVEDVKGYIQNNGENYLYSGYWKVYSDEETKKKIFQDYEFSKEKLIRMIAANYHIRSIIKLFDEQPMMAV